MTIRVLVTLFLTFFITGARAADWAEMSVEQRYAWSEQYGRNYAREHNCEFSGPAPPPMVIKGFLLVSSQESVKSQVASHCNIPAPAQPQTPKAPTKPATPKAPQVQDAEVVRQKIIRVQEIQPTRGFVTTRSALLGMVVDTPHYQIEQRWPLYSISRN